MTRATLEDLFRRFQQSADPRAMAAVYDRVAPELLLLAAHLGQREGEAEDLLQATFLTAIESAGDYDPQRPLLPWLMGILVNQARRQWRERQRRPDPDRLQLPLPPAPDPLQAAADAEFADEFARKLSALPGGYRQVLTLRWVHGLTPTQVAHSLGLPVDTVKTRLRRGNEILRRSLPAGFAAAAFAAAMPARDLATVREVVLARAEAVHAARAALYGGTPLLAKVLLGAGGVALAAAVVTSWALGLWQAEPLDPLPRGSGTGESGKLLARTADRPRAGDAPVRLENSAPRDPDSALSLRLRFADGSSVSGGQAVLHLVGEPDPLLRERWVRTDRRGEVRLQGLPPGRWSVAAARGGPPVRLRLEPGVRGEAEVTVPPGVDLRGRVHDGGRPLAGAGLWLARSGRHDEGRVLVTTDAEGRFALRGTEVGRAFSVLADGYAPRPLQRLPGEPGELELDLDMAAHRSNWTLNGRVLDGRGEPVAGAFVQLGRRLPFLDFDNAAMGGEARVPPVVLKTDEEGRFSRSGFLVFGRRLDLWARADGYAPARTSVLFGPGEREREVELRLLRGRKVSGRLTGEDREPVPGVLVRARTAAAGDAAHAPRWADVTAWTDADGRYELTGVGAGEVQLSALSDDERQAVARLDRRGDLVWNAVLLPPAVLTGFVVDSTGAPLPDLQVRGLVDEGRHEPTPVRTDPRGAFALEECDPGEHTLWITDPGSPWSGRLVARPGVRAREGPVTVIVPSHMVSTAALEGRVVDAAGQPLAADLALGNLRVGRTYSATDPETGRFRIAPLPALSDWHLFVRNGAGYWTAAGGFTTGVGAVTDVGEIVLEPPGRIRVRLRRADGAPVRRAAAKLTLRNGLVFEALEVRDGVALSRPLPPGEFRLHFVGPEIPLTPTPFLVEPGRESEVPITVGPGTPCTFAFEHADDGWDLRLDLVWLDGAGRELCRDQLQLPRGGPFTVRQCLAPGRYVLRARSHAGKRGELAFEIGGTPPQTPLRLLLR